MSRATLDAVRRVLVGVVLGLVMLVAAVAALSELSGEVVILQTRDGDGAWHKTRLWIVDYDGAQWIRAGGGATQSPSSWFARLTLDPHVRLERGGVVGDFNAVPMPEMQSEIHARMREDYSFADLVIRSLGSAAASGQDDPSIPIRLEPVQEESWTPADSS